MRAKLCRLGYEGEAAKTAYTGEVARLLILLERLTGVTISSSPRPYKNNMMKHI
jgi:hypothetical protein